MSSTIDKQMTFPIISPMELVDVNAWRESLTYFIPKLILAFVIVMGGLVLGNVVKNILQRLLRRLKKTGFTFRLHEEEGKYIHFSSQVVKYVIYFLAVIFALYILGFTALEDFLQEVVAYIPRIIASLIILVVGLMLGEYLSRWLSLYLVESNCMGLVKESRLLRRLESFSQVIIKGFIYVIVSLIVLEELGISPRVSLVILMGLTSLLVFSVLILFFFICRKNLDDILAGFELRNQNKKKAVYQDQEVEIIQVGLLSTSVKSEKGTWMVRNKQFMDEVFLR